MPPPNITLVFDVELLAVTKKDQPTIPELTPNEILLIQKKIKKAFKKNKCYKCYKCYKCKITLKNIFYI